MNSSAPKNPATPPQRLGLRPSDLHFHDGPLWRIHKTAGRHPAAWNSMRHYGPLSTFRWEPHLPPVAEHKEAAVLYAAEDYTTAFGEVFQARRRIHLTDQRTLSGWYPSRPLTLLNLMPPSDWALHNGASASLPYASRNICRAWASGIWGQFKDQIDGLRAPSTVTGEPMIVLFSRSKTAFPQAPNFSRALEQIDVASLALRASRTLNWAIH